MYKRKDIWKRITAVLAAATLLMSSVPALGQEFSAGETEEFISDEIDSSEETVNSETDSASLTEDSSEQIDSEEVFTAEDEEIDNFQDGTGEVSETEDGIRYIEGRPLTEEEKEEQLQPIRELTSLGTAPVLGNDPDDLPMGKSSYAANASRFDARDSGLVTSVKDQNPYGMCWAFSMASLMETSLLIQGKGTYDLSEEHLAYFIANRQNDPLGNTANDRNVQPDYREGGNNYIAASFLSTWSGMTTQDDVPNFIVPNKSKAYNTAAYLRESAVSDYSESRMKMLLGEYKSVSFMYYMEDAYFNTDTAAYSYNGYNTNQVNHVATVVGWDDTYSASNFSKASGVTEDGAWIVKNSWGADWGDDGYLYVSYKDPTICALVSVRANTKVNYPNNYFYDGTSSIDVYVTLKPGESAANIFKATAGNGKTEVLGEVDVTTLDDKNIYSVQVYTNLKDKSNPVSGTPASNVSYNTAYHNIAGTYTAAVSEVKLSPDSYYSVVITNKGTKDMKLCCEQNLNYGWFQCKADIQLNQGFAYKTVNGQKVWSDLYYSSCTPRIKAHTRISEKKPAAVKVTAKASAYNKISLSWGTSAGCGGYVIYRQEAGKTAKALRELGASTSSYTDTSVKTGVKYTYTIKPYITVNGSRVYGDTSNKVTLNTTLGRPAFKAKSTTSYNLITWNKVAGAHRYRIYRKGTTGSWKFLKEVKSTTLSYKDTTAKALNKYSYTVRECRIVDRKKYVGRYTAGEVIITAPGLQSVSSVTSRTDGIRITWRAQKGCTGYRIYRKTKNGSYKVIRTITGENYISYVDKTASKGVTYYYAVKSYVKSGGANVYSRYRRSSAVRRR